LKNAWGMALNKEKEVPEESSNDVIMREPSYLEVVENRIYFYSEIGRTEVLKLNRTLSQEGIHLRNEAANQNREPASMYLHINSYGGSIFAGFSALDAVLASPVPVYTIVDGCCASAATLFSVAGKKRYINKHGFMLIHQLSSVMWGKLKELKDEQQNLDRFMSMIKDVYKEFTKVPQDKLDEILEHDLWFDAETCIKYGLVDEIIQ